VIVKQNLKKRAANHYWSLWLAGSLTQISGSRITTNIKDIDDDEALKQILKIQMMKH